MSRADMYVRPWDALPPLPPIEPGSVFDGPEWAELQREFRALWHLDKPAGKRPAVATGCGQSTRTPSDTAITAADRKYYAAHQITMRFYAEPQAAKPSDAPSYCRTVKQREKWAEDVNKERARVVRRADSIRAAMQKLGIVAEQLAQV